VVDVADFGAMRLLRWVLWQRENNVATWTAWRLTHVNTVFHTVPYCSLFRMLWWRLIHGRVLAWCQNLILDPEPDYG
jgi:hypothetical protein